jgi:hypothetical protein
VCRSLAVYRETMECVFRREEPARSLSGSRLEDRSGGTISSLEAIDQDYYTSSGILKPLRTRSDF